MSLAPRWLARLAVLATLVLPGAAACGAAEAPYPFEGTWIRAEHSCTPQTVRARTYTAKEVVSPLGRCSIRRIAASGSFFELVEDCRRNERSQTVTESLRLTSADTMTLKRQLSRLKIPRQLRYARCSVASGAVPASPVPRPTRIAPLPEQKTRP